MSTPFCNKCNRLQDFAKTSAYFIWRCKHIACEKCIKNCTCPVCGVPSKPINYSVMLGKLAEPIKQYRHFQRLWGFKLEQEARRFHYFVTKLPARLNEVNRKIAELENSITVLQLNSEKEDRREKKMKKFLEFVENQATQQRNRSNAGSWGPKPKRQSLSSGSAANSNMFAKNKDHSLGFF